MADAAASPHLQVRPDWLALTQEAVLEPELPIVDAHHHLWDRAGNRYLFEQWMADLSSGHRITGRCSCNAVRCTGRTGRRPCSRWARWSSSMAWRRNRPAAFTVQCAPARPSSALPT
jgi:hypothetical protein